MCSLVTAASAFEAMHRSPKPERFNNLLPVLILPNAEPFDQVLGALQFGMETILLPFEPSHVLHRHTGRASKEGETGNPTTIMLISNHKNTNSFIILTQFIQHK